VKRIFEAAALEGFSQSWRRRNANGDLCRPGIAEPDYASDDHKIIGRRPTPFARLLLRVSSPSVVPRTAEPAAAVSAWH
jgi:hypothetical protein